MLIKTHLAITTFFVLLLLPFVEFKLIFIVVSILATYIPDIDSPSSKIGNHWYFRPIQWVSSHRGKIHSFTFLIFITLILVFFFPILSFPFFLGYSSHLFADSFTLEGIHPFYPSKVISNGDVRTGGIFEMGILFGFLVADISLFIIRLSSVF
jgi:inner membrane protein